VKEKDKEKDKDKDKKAKSKLAGLGVTDVDSGQSTGAVPTTYTLVCKKEIWTPDDQFLESDFVTNILHAQVIEDYLNGNLISMTELTPEFAEVAAQIAALQMKCGQHAGDHFILSHLVPQAVFQRKDEAWWREKVNAESATLKDQPEIIFKRRILTTLQKLPLFGSTTFLVKSSPDPRLPNGCVVCFNINGIHILDRVTKLPVVSCGYNALIEYRYDATEFVMHTGDLMNKSRIVFHTKQGVQICNTLDTTIEYLVKRRKEEKAKEKTAGESSARPSLKKYSPW